MTKLMQVISSRVTRLVVIVAAIYWPLAWVMPFEYLRELLDGVAVATSLVVIAVYLPLTSEELLKNRLDRSGRLLLGIVLSWLAVLLMRPWAIYGRLYGHGDGLSSSLLLGFILWVIIWAGVLHILAPGADTPHPPRRHWQSLSWVLLIGGLIAGLIIGARLSHWIEPAVGLTCVNF